MNDAPAGGRRGGLHTVLLALAWTLLAVWAVGIAVAGWQLGSWRAELTRMSVAARVSR